MVVNPDKTSTSNLPYVLKYDDPLESDEEVDPRDPEDFIEEIYVTRTEPDPGGRVPQGNPSHHSGRECTHHTLGGNTAG
jgi:hypothetical protein